MPQENNQQRKLYYYDTFSSKMVLTFYQGKAGINLTPPFDDYYGKKVKIEKGKNIYDQAKQIFFQLDFGDICKLNTKE